MPVQLRGEDAKPEPCAEVARLAREAATGSLFEGRD